MWIFRELFRLIIRVAFAVALAVVFAGLWALVKGGDFPRKGRLETHTAKRSRHGTP